MSESTDFQFGLSARQALVGAKYLLFLCGLVCALSAADAQTTQTETTYSCDALGRLVRVEVQSPEPDAKVREIDYDAAGNRTRYAASGGSNSSGGSGGEPGTGDSVYAVLPINGMSIVRIR